MKEEVVLEEVEGLGQVLEVEEAGEVVLEAEPPGVHDLSAFEPWRPHVLYLLAPSCLVFLFLLSSLVFLFLPPPSFPVCLPALFARSRQIILPIQSSYRRPVLCIWRTGRNCRSKPS